MSVPESYIMVDQSGVGWEITESCPGQDTVYEHEHTDIKQMPKAVANFLCQCGSTLYEAIYHPRPVPAPFGPNTIIGPGPNAGMPTVERRTIKEYYCQGCTTRFGDPAKYSRNQPAEVVAPVATPKPVPEYILQMRKRLVESFGPTEDPG